MLLYTILIESCSHFSHYLFQPILSPMLLKIFVFHAWIQHRGNNIHRTFISLLIIFIQFPPGCIQGLWNGASSGLVFFLSVSNRSRSISNPHRIELTDPYNVPRSSPNIVSILNGFSNVIIVSISSQSELVNLSSFNSGTEFK